MGASPLQHNGIIHQETDWLLVLGYAPLAAQVLICHVLLNLVLRLR